MKQNVPNILIFNIDDLPYTSDWTHSAPDGTQLNGKTVNYVDVNTPNIQSIIDEGIVIPRTYSSGPKCSPSRYSLLTGRYVVRSEWAISKTNDLYYGTDVTLSNCALYGMNDNTNNIPYLLKNNIDNPYYTGMVGKWHLMSTNNNGNPSYDCSTLTTTPDPILYEECKDFIKFQGFDMVDAWYYANILDNAHFSHNPEWMVHVAQNFIDQSIHIEIKPFFLYFSFTLTHSPNMLNALCNFTYFDTPKGILTGNDIPNNTGMSNRSYIYQQTLEYGGTNHQRNEIIAGTLWVDDAIGAMIKYLKNNNLYDNTFIIVTNDHGQGARGLLYEQGSRIIQFIRYPKLFNITNGEPYILSNNFITSSVDLASVIFNIANINENYQYEIDGINWIPDVINEINDSSGTYEPLCCEYRYMDNYNSHAIVSKEWKYIYKAINDNDITGLYLDSNDTQQLYNLILDPNEQFNQMNNNSLLEIICNFQLLMIQYIDNVVCTLGINACKQPTAICTPSPTTYE